MSGSDEERGEVLLGLARAALEQRLLGVDTQGPDDAAAAPEATWLDEPGAVFVTLTKDGELRGCIGSLEATRPLAVDVAMNAVGAALRDSRFPPVAPDELEQLRLEITQLEPPEPLVVTTEAEALAAIRPGIDGLTLEEGRKRGTFLPQVWEQLPEPADFLRQLKRKAGLPAEGWKTSYRLSRYEARKWSEKEKSS